MNALHDRFPALIEIPVMPHHNPDFPAVYRGMVFEARHDVNSEDMGRWLRAAGLLLYH
jgi:hypothetical protein